MRLKRRYDDDVHFFALLCEKYLVLINGRAITLLCITLATKEAFLE